MTPCVNATFVMPELNKLAEERSKATGESFIMWYDVLQKGVTLAHGAKIDPDAFLMIAHNSSSASQFLVFMEALSRYAKENPYGENAFNLVAHYIDQSNYSIKDWVDAIDYFYNWLSTHYQQASLTTILGYISKCAENEKSSKRNNSKFIEIIDKVLGTYGFQD